jgi:Ricin-type beta-trefoil lectin domain-like
VTANGAKIDQWQCLYDKSTGLPNANQFWSAHYVSSDTGGYYYLIYNANSGKCLEDAGWSRSAGAKIDQWTCYEHNSNQQWYPYYAGGEDWWLDNRYSNYVLGIAGDGFSNGEQAIQERYVNQNSEQNLSEWWSTTPGFGWNIP